MTSDDLIDHLAHNVSLGTVLSPKQRSRIARAVFDALAAMPPDTRRRRPFVPLAGKKRHHTHYTQPFQKTLTFYSIDA